MPPPKCLLGMIYQNCGGQKYAGIQLLWRSGHAATNNMCLLHDSKVAAASGFHWSRLSEEVTPLGYCVLFECAFPLYNKDLSEKLVRARKDNERSDLSAGAAMAALDILLERAMTS